MVTSAPDKNPRPPEHENAKDPNMPKSIWDSKSQHENRTSTSKRRGKLVPRKKTFKTKAQKTKKAVLPKNQQEADGCSCDEDRPVCYFECLLGRKYCH